MKHTPEQTEKITPLAVEAVLFDVGGTLIEPWPSVGHIYAEVAENFGGNSLDIERLNRQFLAAWKAKGDFHYTPEHWLGIVIESFQGMIHSEGCQELFPKLYQRFEDPDVWKVHEDVMPVLDELANRGFRLGIVSNWDTRLKPLLSRLRLDGFFEFVSVSCDIGFTKPSPVIFEHTVGKFGLPPERMLHVGDHQSEDVKGAQGAGLHSLLIDRSARSRPEVIRELTELSERITESWS
ncbi:MAG: HAD-IA family hydrolase [Verrucomicrobia bacterium]|jgi:putative hydrolase of the HAD superfamily|nr:HAD-IA family hydrolase [Verrucomicrobiota bacterium]